MEATEAQIDMHSYHSDVFKDVHNIRPRWLRPEDHTVEEWRAMIDDLLVESREISRREREEEGEVAEPSACEPLRVPLAAFITR